MLTVKILSKDAKLIPRYASEQSSGCDLCANIQKNIILRPGKWKLIPTGIQIEMSKNFEAQIRPRSGLALRYGITVLNTPGTIDADYRDEIAIILLNLGEQSFVVHKYDRIAQLVFSQTYQAVFLPVVSLKETNRRGGFGSTDRK